MPKKCLVEGCEREHHAKGYCGKHYAQLTTFGCIKERTTFDKNEIIIHNDYAEVYVYNKQSEVIGIIKIDINDVEEIRKYKWCLGTHKYPTSCIDNKNVRLHRFLLNPKDDEIVDHINGDILDNRRKNLRICTQQENCMNQGLRKNNTSGVKGVSWCKNVNKWRARIYVNGKDINLGLFTDLEEAKKARKIAEEKYFGKFNRK